jgi:hypothetical protein
VFVLLLAVGVIGSLGGGGLQRTAQNNQAAATQEVPGPTQTVTVAGPTTTVTATVPGPTQTVTQKVEVTPQACLDALNYAEEIVHQAGTGYGAFEAASQSFVRVLQNGVTQADLDTVQNATTVLDSGNVVIQRDVPLYNASAAACRTASK